MNQIFAQHLRKFVLVFFHDILIYNNSMADHVDHLKQVLDILRANSLTAKLSKCVIATDKSGVPGAHHIRARGSY
jgi:hypothetical protein